MSSLSAKLAKRLEEDDKYQAKARTGEEYDTMSPKWRKSSNKARLLDTWIAGANTVHPTAPYTSAALLLNGDKDDASLDEASRVPLDSNGPALEV